MRNRTSFFLAAAVVVAAALPVVAQMGMRPPVIRGVWNPTVGAGAMYEEVGQDGTKRPFSVAIVGKEDVNGAPGFWMEMGITRDTGDVYVQQLMVGNGSDAHVEKTVVMIPGRGPMEMPGGMGRGQTEAPKSDFRVESEKVGTESVTTPAGTFECEHWRAKDGGYDAWMSAKVTPWGIVKGTGTHGSLTLVKTISEAKSHITGTPQKFDPSTFGRRGN
jgi:hypothetical protein